MFYKLALKNVTKSVKDFTVYFLTLTFGVCIFYVFNSIDSQQAMMDMSEAQAVMVHTMMQLIDYCSVFISFILAGLILYANKFMIRRRKKELGVYMTLGMQKGKISIILLVETFIIGVFSLAIGLLVGVFLSQGLAVITAKLFEVQIKQFRFIFSPAAFGKTILYFAIIFVVVMLFNSISVSRCKLINLLNAEKKNERLKMKKLWVSVVLFLISVVCLAFAYRMIIHNGMMYLNDEFRNCIILGAIGTFLFFMSLSGFLLRVLKSNKRIYYKNLNMFVLRQINSKINTTYISMTFICLMLLLSIGIMTVGAGFSGYMKNDISEYAPYDASFETTKNDGDFDIAAFFNKEMNLNTNELFAASHQYYNYDSGLKFSYFMDGSSVELKDEIKSLYGHRPLVTVKLSDYNTLMEMTGKEKISMSDSQYAFVTVDTGTTVSDYQACFQEFLDKQSSITVGGKPLSPYGGTFLRMPTSDDTSVVMLLVPDGAATALAHLSSSYCVMYKGDKDAVEEQLVSVLMNDNAMGKYQDVELNGITKLTFYQETVGLKTIMLFIGVYMGIIFLIASAAVLALQQLSEASDNAYRYILLRKLGAEEKMLSHSILAQVAIYFFIPLVLAIGHSIVGVYAFNKTLNIFQGANAVSSIIFTLVFFAVIYGGYFIATYFGCKGMAKGKND